MSRKTKKRTLSLFVAAVMLLSLLAGCTNEQGAGTPSPTASTPVESAAPSAAPSELEELGSGDVKWSEEKTADGWMRVTNEGGPTLGYSPDSGVKLLQSDGFAFKDLNQNGALDPYEDWRLDAHARAEDLAGQMTTEEQLPLMFSDMFDLTFTPGGELSEYITGILDNGLRGLSMPFVLSSVEDGVTYINLIQAYVEAKPYGIPVDEHSEAGNAAASSWPNNLGMAATFDPEVAAAYAKTMSEEYRALGITTTYTPQIDPATEPRWSRIATTFGEDPALARDMAVAHVNAQQSSYDENGNDLGWGTDSVNAMLKHFPGDGAGEGGRESHNFYGKYTVFPGDQFYTHLIPFVGAMDLPGKTGSAAAVMPSYSAAIGADGSPIGGKVVGSSYSEFKLTELLREELGFEGLVCSDFSIGVETNRIGRLGKPWGVEELSLPDRYLTAVEAGLDQFGGESNVDVLREAYALGAEEYGEEHMQERINGSAVRILKNMFQVGLFENAYLDTEYSLATVNTPARNEAGHAAMLKSVVMLKNSGDIIHQAADDAEKPTVYIPMTYSGGNWSIPVDMETAFQYFEVVTDKVSDTLTGPEDANGKVTASVDDIIRASDAELAACDFALVRISSPKNAAIGNAAGAGGGTGDGYDTDAGKYIPISLQYGPYTANSSSVRLTSISGDQVEVSVDSPYGAQTVYENENRSYFGNSARVSNASDLDAVLYAAEHVDKVIVSVNLSNPMVFSEFESQVDAILVDFNNAGPNITKALCEIITGQVEPSGLLPLQMPADMETVEAQYEDVPRDMECHVDSDGNTYDFAYGLNWSGVISDERTAKYDVPPLVG
ncbi:glycoside hydrolase family 3 protein [Pseudoflavonifractor phocaeensis]|uniref:glycoside hydrolase family 3 protein n=1 Tax=Pseudoflavonifractor phocaeensis TaxID=1870988 RepID=UPI00210B3AAA|nr:glycoside hydrolase family 3 N-terminal domain-containing protein [Pseudoflavonifractor phocaeensis]MCQ4863075.1 glycoside hydrolase family 3 C-terminal domain-containing protein [Pseudoflavonifractor phocaeensis]